MTDKAPALDTSMLAPIDTNAEDLGYQRVSFCTRIGAHYVDVVTLLIMGRGFRLGGSSLPPAADYVQEFADAWRRCLLFIGTNKLTAGWTVEAIEQ